MLSVCCAGLAGNGPWFFLGVYSIGEAGEVMNLTSLKLLQFAFFQIPATLIVGVFFKTIFSPFLYAQNTRVYRSNQADMYDLGV